jgi:hypothetical protein
MSTRKNDKQNLQRRSIAVGKKIVRVCALARARVFFLPLFFCHLAAIWLGEFFVVWEGGNQFLLFYSRREMRRRERERERERREPGER